MRTLALFTLTCLMLLGCSSEQRETPTAPATRIVSISPAASDILIGLECDHLIVGRHNYDTALDPSVPPVGDQSGIDYEKLLSLDPTHVIVQTESLAVPPRLIELAASSGFDITNISTLALGDILDSAETLAEKFAPDSDLADRFEHAIRHRDEASGALGGVLVTMHSSPTVDVLGPGSAHHEIIERLGFAPAITVGKPYMPLDAEDVLAIDPGVIVFVRPRQPGAVAAGDDWAPSDDDLGVLAGLDVSAVRLGRVILIDEPQALTSGTSLIGVIDTLERRLGALSPLGSQHDDNHNDNSEAGPG